MFSSNIRPHGHKLFFIKRDFIDVLRIGHYPLNNQTPIAHVNLAN